MSASYDLFCRWKHVQKIQSDNAGALALGVSRATVSLWKQGKNAEIHYVERMAVDIGDSPEMWSAVVMAERSNSEDEKAAWRRIAQKLATFALALCLAVGFSLPRDAQASVHQQGYENGHSIHYAKCVAARIKLGEQPALSAFDPVHQPKSAIWHPAQYVGSPVRPRCRAVHRAPTQPSDQSLRSDLQVSGTEVARLRGRHRLPHKGPTSFLS